MVKFYTVALHKNCSSEESQYYFVENKPKYPRIPIKYVTLLQHFQQINFTLNIAFKNQQAYKAAT